MVEKRSSTSAESSVVKRTKTDGPSNALIATNGNKQQLIQIPRTSSLQAPIMLLSGHSGGVFSCKFNHNGSHIASGSFDKSILLWNTFGDCKNYGVLKGHQGAVLDLHWSRDSSLIFSASTDKSVGVWDTETGARLKRLRSHQGIVNACSPGRRGSELVASCGDDSQVKLWDLRQKHPAHSWESKYPLTSVAFGENGDALYTGGIDNDIHVWDIRQGAVQFTMSGHEDMITGLSVSPDGSYLLSNGMDNTVRVWDIRPFAKGNRNIKHFEGAPHGYEKNLIKPAWSPNGERIACGSADRSVVVWDVTTRMILYKLPGHKGCVNEVDFHPTEPILLSGASDRQLYLGELKPSS